MERSTYARISFISLYSFFLGAALVVLSAIGVLPLALLTPGVAALLLGLSLVIRIIASLWSSQVGEKVAYRVLYHSDTSPNGEVAFQMLNALARNMGHVSLIWRFRPSISQERHTHFEHPGTPGEDRGQILEEISKSTEPKYASVFDVPCQSAPGIPSISSDLPRDMDALRPKGTLAFYMIAPAEARAALEGIIPRILPGASAERCTPYELSMLFKPTSYGRCTQAWRWQIPPAGGVAESISDPLACGTHIEEIAASLAATMSTPTVLEEMEVRLKLWPCGVSAVVCAQRRSDSTAPGVLSSGGKAHVEQERTLSSRLNTLSSVKPLPFLLPLLWSYRTSGKHKRKESTTKEISARRPRNVLSQPCELLPRLLPARLVRILVSILAVYYPLWNRYAAVSPPGQRNKYDQLPSPTGLETPQPGTTQGASSSIIPGVPCLIFPPTTGYFSSLDAVEAGQIPLPDDYVLPPVPSRVLVLGSATEDGRAVGIPALSASRDGLIPPKENITSPAEPLTSTSPSSTTHKARKTRRAHLKLHPMLAEHLLIAGGTDVWRGDVAGSLVSQASSMEMMVVVIDGGPPPDEVSQAASQNVRSISADPGRPMRTSRISFVHTGSMQQPKHEDPFSSIGSRNGTMDSDPERTIHIDLDNPVGSARPNMLYVPPVGSLPVVQGEALATTIALKVGIDAQLQFLNALNVTCMDAGLSGISGISGISGMWDISTTSHIQPSTDSRITPEPAEISNTTVGPGARIIEAWLTVLLLRHHRARLSVAVRDVSQPASKSGAHEFGSLNANSSREASSMQRVIPSCPDLAALLSVLDQPETMLTLLKRERRAWNEPNWVSILSSYGAEGAGAIQAAHVALEKAHELQTMKSSDLLLFSSALRGQLDRIIRHPAMMRMLGNSHVSLGELLDQRHRNVLKVNLSGAYRTLQPPCSNEDVLRKNYGLYLLWSVWAASRQRSLLAEHFVEHHPTLDVDNCDPKPVLLMLHGAGAWFGPGSPLTEPAALANLGHARSGIAVAATVGSLRHVRAYRDLLCETFGNLIIGPPHLARSDLFVSDHKVVDLELRILQDMMQQISGAVRNVSTLSTSTTTNESSLRPHSNRMGQGLDHEQLSGVLRLIAEGAALIVTNMPGGRKVVCTCQVGSMQAAAIRGTWKCTLSI